MEPIPDTYLDLFFGYTAIWALVLFFLVRMMREQSRLRKDMDDVQSRLHAQQSHTTAKNVEKTASMAL